MDTFVAMRVFLSLTITAFFWGCVFVGIRKFVRSEIAKSTKNPPIGNI